MSASALLLVLPQQTVHDVKSTSGSSTSLSFALNDEGKDDDSSRPVRKVLLRDTITSDNPVFVLSFPNSGSLTMDRYFKCAGLDEETLGRRWTRKKLDQKVVRRQQIGKCMTHNLERTDLADRNPLHKCGGDGGERGGDSKNSYRVWMELESSQRGVAQWGRQCLFPTLKAGVLSQLFRHYPNATVINVIKDPNEWYETLPDAYKERWPRWCNEMHDNVFPEANGTKAEWVKLYEKHHQNIRHEVEQHQASISLIEIQLGQYNNDDSIIAQELEEKLGISQKCWLEDARNPARNTDIGLPIFNLALPKSATSTTHAYLNCGLGAIEGAHQWIIQEDDVAADEDGASVTVAHCMQANMNQSQKIVHGCGDTVHYSDIGVYRRANCFYPSMSPEWLEAMYRDYPTGTIINVVRNSTAWYRSAEKWNALTERWSLHCPGFPGPKSTEQQWVAFYENHAQQIRDFAKDHPSMTFVEFALEDGPQIERVLDENFGFRSSCWGHKNDNSQGQAAAMRTNKVKPNITMPARFD